ncbi:MAG: O-antigen ligase family protein, partial [Oscillospiraceae bacterium]
MSKKNAKKPQKAVTQTPTAPASVPTRESAPVIPAPAVKRVAVLREDPRKIFPLLLPLLVIGILAMFGGHGSGVALIAALCALVALFAFHKAFAQRLDFTALVLMAYVLFGLSSLLWATSGKLLLGALAPLVLGLAFYLFILLRSGNTEEAVRSVAAALAGCSGLFALISVDGSSVNLLTRLVKLCLPGLADLSTGFEAGTRITGIFGNANVLAGVLALGTLLSLYLVLSAQSKRQSYVSAALLAVNALGFLLAFSMGGLAVFAVAIVVYLVAAREERISALVVMVEIGVTTLMSTFVAMLGLGKSGFLLCLPLLALVFNCVAFWALHHFLGGKLTELLQSRRRLASGFFIAVIVLIVAYIGLGVTLTGSYTLRPGEVLRRSAYPEAGEHTLVTTADSPISVTIESQNAQQIMMHTSTVLYQGDGSQATFSVPEDSRVVYVNYSTAGDTVLQSSTIDGKAIKLKYTLFPGFVANRIQGLRANQNAIQRTVFWKDGLKIFAQSPIIGRGLGGFESHVISVQDFYYETTSTHNHYIQSMAELGIIGLLLFLGMFATTGFSLWQGRKAEKYRKLYPALWASLAMIAGHCAVEVVFSFVGFIVFAFCVFALISLCYGTPRVGEKLSGKLGFGALGLFLVLAVLLSGNQMGRMLMKSYNGAEGFFRNAELAAKVDVFERNDYRISYVANALQSGSGENLETALNYADSLIKIPSNTIPKMIVSFYLNLGSFDKAAQAARTGISYVPADAETWNVMLDQLRTAVP